MSFKIFIYNLITRPIKLKLKLPKIYHSVNKDTSGPIRWAFGLDYWAEEFEARRNDVKARAYQCPCRYWRLNNEEDVVHEVTTSISRYYRLVKET